MKHVSTKIKQYAIGRKSSIYDPICVYEGDGPNLVNLADAAIKARESVRMMQHINTMMINNAEKGEISHYTEKCIDVLRQAAVLLRSIN
jgi:hypothetical protein